MLDPTLYYAVYLIIVTVYTIFLSNRYRSYTNGRLSRNVREDSKAAFILMLVMTLFIGLRPHHRVFTDMSNYEFWFTYLAGRNFEFNFDTSNKVFDNFLNFMAMNGYAAWIFFFIMAALYFGGIFYYSKRMFPKDTLYAMVIYLGAFSTFSYGTNGIKAGVAAALFLCALANLDKKVALSIFLVLSLGFHHSMLMPIVALIICLFYKNTKVILGCWILSILIAAAHITFFQALFGGMADESGAGYLALSGEQSFASYRTGFRPDFILYSAFPVAVGYYAIFKKGYKSVKYTIIYNTYLLSNAVWMLCMYANFTNRIAYLSWLFLPVVLIYPFFDKSFVKNQYKKLNNIAWLQLGFTIFMEVVYYEFIK